MEDKFIGMLIEINYLLVMGCYGGKENENGEKCDDD